MNDLQNLLSAAAREVTEAERGAAEAALQARFGAEGPVASGAAGASPYAPVARVFGPTGLQRGDRVQIVAVCRSYNGAGAYKGRGRWATVWAMAQKTDGPWAVCDAGDRGAEEVGASGLYLRPWEEQEAENRGNTLGAAAVADAFAALGL